MEIPMEFPMEIPMEANGNIHEIFFTVKESQYSKIFHEFDSEISSLKKNFFLLINFRPEKIFFLAQKLPSRKKIIQFVNE